jgi:hypothetical protein
MKICKCPSAHEKMLKIFTSREYKSNPRCNPTCIDRMDIQKCQIIRSAGNNVEASGSSYNIIEDVKWCHHIEKQPCTSSKVTI